MWDHEDYFSKLEVYEDEYSSNEPFNSREIGFHIAAAISDYSDSKEIIEDPTYGEVVFMRKNWDTKESPSINWPTLKYRQCNENDFNWGDGRPSDESSKFYPLTDQALVDVPIFGHLFKCLDEDVEMFGNFDAAAASNLVVGFMLCDPESGLQCKNSTEVSEWLSDKYIVTVENEQKFIQQEFDEGKYISSRSSLKWYSASA